MKLPVAQYLSISRANGPGKRCVLWFQGCDKACPNCCNPSFQEFKEANVDVHTLAAKIRKDIWDLDLRGMTLSGGEPLHPNNKDGLILLLDLLRKTPKDIFVFTGYETVPDWSEPYIDMAIAGPYIQSLDNPKGLVASSNQKICRFSNRFDDVLDDDLINGERIIEVLNVCGKTVVSGLIENLTKEM